MKCGNKPNCKTKFTEVKHRDGLKYFCSFDCKQEYLQKKFSEEKNFFIEKKIPKKINQVSKTNKNTIAKFSQETKEKILERDGGCIICGSKFNIEYHHAYFGANANRKESRNDTNQGVALCSKHHHEIHHGNNGEGQKIRKECIFYLTNFIK